jgi:hypothetical protein
MKILLIAVAGVVLLVVAVVVIGSLLPKRHVVSRSASYQAAPESLYSLVTGPQNWRPDVLRSEAVPDGNGRELMRETTRDGETINYELLDAVPPNPLSGESRLRTYLTPAPGPTPWSHTAERRSSGSLKRAKSTIRCSGLCRVSYLVTRARWMLTCVRWARRPQEIEEIKG